MKVTVFFISILLSLNVLSETYICSQELSRFNQPGKIETMRFERNGNIFMGGIEGGSSFQYNIDLDSKSFLILTNLNDFIPSLAIVFIDKDTKEWGMSYLSMAEFMRFPTNPLSYGKCVVVN